VGKIISVNSDNNIVVQYPNNAWFWPSLVSGNYDGGGGGWVTLTLWRLKIICIF